jgi:DNA-directed RNA polymerase subunit H
MALIAAEGTTSQGKKELKSRGIDVLKDLENIELKEKTSPKKKKEVIETKEVEIGEDISLSKLPDNELMRVAKRLLQRREPDVINLKQIGKKSENTIEIRAFSSDRKFIESVQEEKLEGIPIALIGKVKFTANTKKEAEEYGINLISLEEENDSKGDIEQLKLNKRLREGAIEIIEQRGFSLLDKKDDKFSKLFDGSDSLGTYLIAENQVKDTLLVLLPSEDVVRVATVREFKEQIDALEVNEGMLIALKRFTYTAEREAKDFGIAALKKNHPVFNIFSHYLVPEHEVMDKLAVDEMLDKYNAKLLQLPRIYEDDPGIVAVNGKVGDVVRIIRDNGENFRLVVPRPEGGRTENTALVKMTDQRMKRLKNDKEKDEKDEI